MRRGVGKMEVVWWVFSDPTLGLSIVGGLVVAIYCLISNLLGESWDEKRNGEIEKNSIKVTLAGEIVYIDSDLVRQILLFYECGKVAIIKDSPNSFYWMFHRFKKHPSQNPLSDQEEITLSPAFQIPSDASNQSSLLKQLRFLPEWHEPNFKALSLNQQFICWDITSLSQE
eukprot:TRINITY_DN11795_c0_g1_i1.p1 TRINITY_DN11795_c0_g1~~TRINITY_DN11795_c0_g1_i1.p1  ORF type:complete len:171 (+),score=33.04 TRINITY_DN11795_c0_g1_i1:3-515(+)